MIFISLLQLIGSKSKQTTGNTHEELWAAAEHVLETTSSDKVQFWFFPV